ncbi:MAG: DKNYY domain-containing protein [Saprospiraceae bacterium]|nr:DKNYY domain-containing protein [Saprospiraceae bacterium]
MFNLFTVLGLLVIFGLIFMSCQSKSHSKSKAKDTGEFTIKGNQVFFEDTEISGMDGATFRILDDYYARDSVAVIWYETYRKSSDYFTSKNIRIKKLEGVNPDQFQVLGYGYGKDPFKLFLNGEQAEIHDLISFRLVNDIFYADKDFVYAYHKKLEGLDGPTFEMAQSHYAKDKNHYYFIQNEAEGKKQLQKIDCDEHTFKILDYPYAVDQEKVFYKDQPIPGLRPSGLKLLGHGYVSDGSAVYFEKVQIKEADAVSFSVFAENDNFLGNFVLAKDKNHVYLQNKIHKLVDASSFQILNDAYNKDAKHVFYRDKIVTGADPATFEVFPHAMGDADARDSRYHYFEGERVSKRED